MFTDHERTSIKQLLSDCFELQAWQPPMGDWDALYDKQELLKKKYGELYKILGDLPPPSEEIQTFMNKNKGFELGNYGQQ